ncbi:hypothetical protein CNMCM6106_004668 [Aspergillus hiratsukae]|uniref:Uncharacterized protein n=1 Tax=Aspergillus hiratsukae TaxID=1194566 RepID=A0A8H6PJB6_9EURO|nr:hypothetical protein CNMCM6106_004668 [Aspergillus hiratsukae]
MCRYTFHHYTRCGHICGFAIQSCVEFVNLLRRSSQPGSNYPELSCTNIKVDHELFSTTLEVHCLQCELDWPEQVSANGTEETVHSIPHYMPIEGLESADPIITSKMQWQWPTNKSRKREFDDAFLELDLDGDRKSDSSDGSTIQASTIVNVSPSSTEEFGEFIDVPLNTHVHEAADEDEDEYENEEDCGPNPAKRRNYSISEDYMVIDTDIPNNQAERVTSRAKGEEDSDEDEDDFFSLWLSDSDSDSGDADTTGPIMRFGNTEDDTASIRRQLESFTFNFPAPRSTPRTPDSPPCSPRTRPRPRPERLPLYVGFPGQPPEKSPRTRRPSSRGNYVDARTELQSPVFDGFPGILPDEDELALRSPGLVSFPRFVEGKEKVEAGKSTGSVLGLCGARLAFCSGRAAVLKGLNMAKSWSDSS